MSTPTEEGYLVLADISGYTSFLAQTELEHAHEILTELLELIVDSFNPVLKISKLEGDAVFAYIAAEDIARGETVLELIEATYVAFKNKTQVMHMRTTCDCNACRSIPKLDLKFIAHYGSFILQKPVAGLRELVGSDVNLAHRLLKNHVSEATSWRAYALFTEKTLDSMGIHPDKMYTEVETYEHLGDVNTFSMNLLDRYAELSGARRHIITEDEAIFTGAVEVPSPPPVVWEWLSDPIKRSQWAGGGAHWSAGMRPGGRTGAGSTNHCAHGKSAFNETVLDWKPFDAATSEMYLGPITIWLMTELQPTEHGTKIRTVISGRSRLPRFILKPVFRFMLVNVFKFGDSFNRMIDLINAEYNAQIAAQASAQPSPEILVAPSEMSV